MDFLNRTQKSLNMNEKIDGLNVIKIKNSHLLQIPLRGEKATYGRRHL